MPYWNDGTHWDSGARWAPAAPITKGKRNMAIIALNTSKLPIPAKIVRGQEIITKSTGNPNVPGNTAALTAFTNAQADFVAANDAYEGSRGTCMNLGIARQNALDAWNTALTGLAALTESLTQGDADKITSTGFDVRGVPTPPQPLPAPINLLVNTNGSPGVSKLTWRLEGADSFLVEMSPEPITDESWEQVAVTTKMRAEVPGAEPGKACWFRVAGVNATGQGPWSEPGRRPVM